MINPFSTSTTIFYSYLLILFNSNITHFYLINSYAIPKYSSDSIIIKQYNSCKYHNTYPNQMSSIYKLVLNTS